MDDLKSLGIDEGEWMEYIKRGDSSKLPSWLCTGVY